MRRLLMFVSVLLAGLLAAIQPAPARSSGPPYPVYIPLVTLQKIAAPVLKWAYGGCFSSWCETGWYASPAVLDINHDGVNEVLSAAYSLVALNGASGATLWRSSLASARTWPGVAAADIDLDGQTEVVIAQGGGKVSAFRPDGVGGLALVWSRSPASTSDELRGLLLADLDGNNGPLEVVVTRAAGSAVNTWVLDAAGNTRAGWPRLPDDSGALGVAWGVYNANAAAADLSGDSKLELIVPSDVHYINAYAPDGSSLTASTGDYGGKNWGKVGVWEDLTVEKRGWGACDGTRAESYHPNFADAPATLADLNGDGQKEVVTVGNMQDCSQGPYLSRYKAPQIFNPDHSRFNVSGADWRTTPLDTGLPLSEDYNLIETAQSNPVVADLDNDGKKEILFASYDGRLHAFWLDKSEHGSWPYSVTKPAEGFIRFASEPLVADLNNDGRAEVIFVSWTEKGSNHNGKLHILAWDGQVLYETDLPAARAAGLDWNGALAAPTLANIDADADLELIVQTVYSGVVAYDLPGSSAARVLWGTGRASYTRAGSK